MKISYSEERIKKLKQDKSKPRIQGNVSWKLYNNAKIWFFPGMVCASFHSQDSTG